MLSYFKLKKSKKSIIWINFYDSAILLDLADNFTYMCTISANLNTPIENYKFIFDFRVFGHVLVSNPICKDWSKNGYKFRKSIFWNI